MRHVPSVTRLRHWLVSAAIGLTLIGTAPVAVAQGVDAPDAGGTASQALAPTPAPTRARAALNRRVFDQVWSEVQHSYYDPTLHGVDWRAARARFRPVALAAPDDRRLYGVLDQMLDLLDDDHAAVAPPAVARRQDRLRQRRAVIGLILYPEDAGVYRIDRVRPGSPAEEAGVGVGWRLDSQGDQGWSPDRDVVGGQALTLRFTDPAGDPRLVTLVPREMDPTPAFVADRSRRGVLVLTIEGFEAGLGRWMGEQLAEVDPDTDVVLDLRGNPGGLLLEADAVLSCFLPERQPWATRTSRSGRAVSMRIRSGCGDLTEPVANDLAVLVDASSRSAAELTPAALQEARRALIVGQRTGGAVLISQDSRLPDGGRLTLSRADFVTSGGVRLEKHGVLPDLTVAETRQDRGDAQLDAAVSALRNGQASQTALAATIPT